MNRSLCPHCRKRLPPGERIHEACIEPWQIALKAKEERKKAKEARAAAKVERAETRRKKQERKRIPELIQEAQNSFNAYIRLRDRGQACICCGSPLTLSAVGGGYDAGHYRSTGSASHLRFNEDNVHAQRKYCNRHKAGRAVDYRIGLIQRIGLERVEALENNNAPHKWEREELIEIAKKYRQKFKELQR